jgi:hypothetical protein
MQPRPDRKNWSIGSWLLARVIRAAGATRALPLCPALAWLFQVYLFDPIVEGRKYTVSLWMTAP